MRQMEQRFAEDEALRSAYASAHDRYLAERSQVEQVDEISGVSAGGMPDRVKCLHVLLAQSLACGRGVNPLGDEVRDLVGAWWEQSPCA